GRRLRRFVLKGSVLEPAPPATEELPESALKSMPSSTLAAYALSSSVSLIFHESLDMGALNLNWKS
ncbi:hypothetical protein NL529_31010, partial [Klebsiella pneumoniae]|nr:hypothetical protein [Klebsiella pneumoniae]